MGIRVQDLPEGSPLRKAIEKALRDQAGGGVPRETPPSTRDGENPAPARRPGKGPRRAQDATEPPDARMVPQGAPGARGPGRRGGRGLPGAPWSAAEPTDCTCGRRHPSRTQALVCLNLRAEVESTGGWVLHEVALPLPQLGPKPRGGTRKRPRPPGAPTTLRVDFLAVWPDGRWKAVEAKHPSRVHRDYPARAGALRTWYGVDPRFLGLEERVR